MISTEKKRRNSSATKVSNFLSQNQFQDALIILEMLFSTPNKNKIIGQKLNDVFNFPIVFNSFKEYINDIDTPNQDPNKEKFFKFLLALSLKHIGITKWRVVFLDWMKTLSSDELSAISKTISKLYNSDKSIEPIHCINACRVLLNNNEKKLFKILYKEFIIDNRISELLISSIANTNYTFKQKEVIRYIIKALTKNSANFNNLCANMECFLVESLKSLNKDGTTFGILNCNENSINKARTLIKEIPATQRKKFFQYLEDTGSDASTLLLRDEILRTINMIESNEEIKDFKTLHRLLSSFNFSYNSTEQKDLSSLIQAIYLTMNYNHIPQQCNSWQKFALYTFTYTTNCNAKKVWLSNARGDENKYITRTFDMFLNMYKKWPSLINKTTSLLCMFFDSIHTVKIQNIDRYKEKFDNIYKKNCIESRNKDKAIFSKNIFHIASEMKANIHISDLYITHDICRIFSSLEFKNSFLVCKGGIAKSFLFLGIPIELVSKIFYHSGMFYSTCINPKVHSAVILYTSNPEILTPNLREFKAATIKKTNDILSQQLTALVA